MSNRILSDGHANGVDVHQLNCTYYAALGEDDERHLAARAIQLFAKGVPQIYYVGLLAGSNDQAAVERTGEGRAVNRHDYTLPEIQATLGRPVVGRLLDLIRLRTTHPAFSAPLLVETPGPSRLRMVRGEGRDRCSLDVDLSPGRYTVRGAATRSRSGVAAR